MAALPYYNSAEQNSAQEPLPVKKKSKAPLMVGLLLLVMACAAAVTVKVVMAKDHQKKGPQKIEVGSVVPLDDFLLNTADPSGDHYVKATIAIGLIKGVSSDDFKNKIPVVRDAIVMDLSSKTMAQLRTTPDKMVLKAELTQKINQELGEQDVADVYLESFATQ